MGKASAASIFKGNLAKSSLWMARRVDRLEEIQKKQPGFNCERNWELNYYLNAIIRDCKKMKKMGVNN